MDDEQQQAYIQNVREQAGGWIGASDAKATSILTLLSVLVGIVLLNDPPDDASFGSAFLVLFLTFLVLTAVAIFCSGLALWPRTNRARLLRKGETLPASPTYFGDLASKSYAEFSKAAEDVDATTLRTDHREQAYVLALIAHKKMFWSRIAIVLACLSVLVLTAVAVLNLLARYAC